MSERRLSREAEKSSKVFLYEAGHHISHRELHRSLAESGFAIVKGIPVDKYTSDDARIGATIEFLHGLPFLGAPLKQNSEGTPVWLVRDEGIKVDFDPFLWRCDSCSKEKQFTEKEIDTTKKPYPDPQNHPYDFYITCSFCHKGVMEPSELVSFSGAFEDFNEE